MWRELIEFTATTIQLVFRKKTHQSGSVRSQGTNLLLKIFKKPFGAFFKIDIWMEILLHFSINIWKYLSNLQLKIITLKKKKDFCTGYFWKQFVDSQILKASLCVICSGYSRGTWSNGTPEYFFLQRLLHFTFWDVTDCAFTCFLLLLFFLTAALKNNQHF